MLRVELIIASGSTFSPPYALLLLALQLGTKIIVPSRTALDSRVASINCPLGLQERDVPAIASRNAAGFFFATVGWTLGQFLRLGNRLPGNIGIGLLLGDLCERRLIACAAGQ